MSEGESCNRRWTEQRLPLLIECSAPRPHTNDPTNTGRMATVPLLSTRGGGEWVSLAGLRTDGRRPHEIRRLRYVSVTCT